MAQPLDDGIEVSIDMPPFQITERYRVNRDELRVESSTQRDGKLLECTQVRLALLYWSAHNLHAGCGVARVNTMQVSAVGLSTPGGETTCLAIFVVQVYSRKS